MTDLLGARVRPDRSRACSRCCRTIASGKLKILGVGHNERLKSLPDIPVIKETVPGYYNTGWWGIVAPAGTPKPIVEKLNGIMNKALATPEMLQSSRRTASRSRPPRRRAITISSAPTSRRGES